MACPPAMMIREGEAPAETVASSFPFRRRGFSSFPPPLRGRVRVGGKVLARAFTPTPTLPRKGGGRKKEPSPARPREKKETVPCKTGGRKSRTAPVSR